MPGGGQIQGHLALLGAIEVGHQATGSPHRQGQLAQAQAIEAGQIKTGFEGGAGLRALKRGARQGREVQSFGAPGGFGALQSRPEHLGRLHLQQLLVQLIAAAALGDPEFARAHIGHGQPPPAPIRHDHRA